MNGERLAATRHWQVDEIAPFLADRDTVDVDSTIYDRILASHGRYQLEGADDDGVKEMDGDEAADFVRTVFDEEDVTKNVLDVVTDGEGYGFYLRLEYDVVPDGDQRAVREKGDTVISGDLPVSDGAVEDYLREYEDDLHDTATADVPVDRATDLLHRTDEVMGRIERRKQGIPMRLFDPDVPRDTYAGPEFTGYEAATDLSYLDDAFDVPNAAVAVKPNGSMYTVTVTCDVNGFRGGTRGGGGIRANHTLIYEAELQLADIPEDVREELSIA